VTLSPLSRTSWSLGALACYVSQAHHGVTPPDFGRSFVQASELTKGHMYAFVLDSNFRTNFHPGAADLLFRYAITTHQGTWKDGKRGLRLGGGEIRFWFWASMERRRGPAGHSEFLPGGQPDVFLLTLSGPRTARGSFSGWSRRGPGRNGQRDIAPGNRPESISRQSRRGEPGRVVVPAHQLGVPLKPFQTVTIRVQPRE